MEKVDRINTIRQYNDALGLVHPQVQKEISLWEQLGMYAWHGKHHLGHILDLKERMGWQ